jgi:DNA-directed RNA polymerase subunit RPC12/RpoP
VVVVEVLVGILVCCFAAVVFAAAVIGLMGALGVLRLARCNRCSHLAVTPGAEPMGSCPYCRHGVLLHPVHALHETFFHPLAVLHQLPVVHGYRAGHPGNRGTSS